MVPAEPGPVPDNAPDPKTMHPTLPTGPFLAPLSPLRFRTVEPDQKDSIESAPKASGASVANPGAAVEESTKQELSVGPKAIQGPSAANRTVSPVSSRIIRPQRWQLADSSGITWYSGDRVQLEKWVAARNACYLAVPFSSGPYGYSAARCAGGRCVGRR